MISAAGVGVGGRRRAWDRQSRPTGKEVGKDLTFERGEDIGSDFRNRVEVWRRVGSSQGKGRRGEERNEIFLPFFFSPLLFFRSFSSLFFDLVLFNAFFSVSFF